MIKKDAKNILVISALLLEFAFTILGGAVFGYLVDSWLKTKPYATIIFIAVSFAACIKIFMIIYSKAKKNMENGGDGNGS